MAYCLYLRKSRADMEAESYGEGETLARHEKLLLDVAKRGHYNITQIYREIVSGDTIAARPVMQKLLQEVERGVWEGVLVVEIERLARGETIDQGIVAQAFKYSETKIITPLKVFDPANEFDEEYFEFGLYMSRREYKTINRRLQRGRIAAVNEGKIVTGKAPYGYERVHCIGEKGWTLRPSETESKVIQYIFDIYVNGKRQSDGTVMYPGTVIVAKELTALGIKSPSGRDAWDDTSVRELLLNPVYIGKIRWGRHKMKRISENGTTKMQRIIVPDNEQIIVDGMHPAIVSEEIFYRAKERLRKGRFVPQNKLHGPLTNPLAGVVVCGKCGYHMIKHRGRAGKPDGLGCRHCDNNGARLSVVEDCILQGLAEWLSKYRLKWNDNSSTQSDLRYEEVKKAISRAESEIQTLQQQLGRTHDLLEQGIYDTETFLVRSRSISSKISDNRNRQSELKKELTELILLDERKKDIIPKVEKLLDVYKNLSDPVAKNELLKGVLEKVTYIRTTKPTKFTPLDDFEITLYPKLPNSQEKEAAP